MRKDLKFLIFPPLNLEGIRGDMIEVYKILAVITRPPDGVLLAPSALAARLVTRAVISRRPDGVS